MVVGFLSGADGGWGSSQARARLGTSGVHLCPASRHWGPGLANVAAALQAGREGRRREVGGGPESLSVGHCGDLAWGCAPGAPASPARFGVQLAMGKSRSTRCCRRGSPGTPSKRVPSAPSCRATTKYRPLGWQPGRQALAGGWERTWARFLSCFFLPTKKSDLRGLFP